MPAPKGNQYALGNHGGAPTKYKDEYCQMMIDYFDKPPQQVVYKETYYKGEDGNQGGLKSKEPIVLGEQYPTLQGFANELGVHIDTLNEWCKVHNEFSEVYARAKQYQEHIMLVNGLGRQYDGNLTQFVLKNHFGYKDKTEVDIGNADNKPFMTGYLDNLSVDDLKSLEDLLNKAKPPEQLDK